MDKITRLAGGRLKGGRVVCADCGGNPAVTYCRAFGGLEEIECRCSCGDVIRMETKEGGKQNA